MNRLRLVLSVLFAWVAITWGAAFAQQAQVRKVAVLVGVSKYEKKGFPDLKYAERDVTELAQVLKGAGFQVQVLLGSGQGQNRATAANLHRVLLGSFLEQVAELGKEDVVLVAFCGHGLQSKVIRDQQGKLVPEGAAVGNAPLTVREEPFFCPADAHATRPQTWFPLAEFLQKLSRESGSLNNLVLIDACRSNPARGRMLDSSQVRQLPAGMAVLFASSAGQRSFEVDTLKHGLFSYYVIRGLRGEAANREGEITWDDLVAYVRRQVFRQSPQLVNTRQRPNQVANLDTLPVLARVDRKLPSPVKPPASTERPSLLKAPFSAQAARSAQEAWSKHLDTPVVKTNSIGMKLVLIPPGEFLMGTAREEVDLLVKEAKKFNSSADRSWVEDELPQHRVRITRPFYLGVYEATQAEFQRVMGRNPSFFSPNGGGKEDVSGLDTSRFPVEKVSWYDAVEFCNRLSQREGLRPYYRLEGIKRDDDGSIEEAKVTVLGGPGYHLPTEAQWEYACRAGTTTPFYFGHRSNGTQSNVDGNYPYGTTQKGPYLERTTRVGSYQPNAFGLFDMHGNVWEWCQDWYDDEFYSRSPTDDPVNRTPGTRRVMRGGSWDGGPWYARSAYRNWLRPVYRVDNVGFRLARIAE